MGGLYSIEDIATADEEKLRQGLKKYSEDDMSRIKGLISKEYSNQQDLAALEEQARNTANETDLIPGIRKEDYVGKKVTNTELDVNRDSGLMAAIANLSMSL